MHIVIYFTCIYSLEISRPTTIKVHTFIIVSIVTYPAI